MGYELGDGWESRGVIVRRGLAFLAGVILGGLLIWYFPQLAGTPTHAEGDPRLHGEWRGTTFDIRIDNPTPNGCLVLITSPEAVSGTTLPDSCGVSTYTIKREFLDSAYDPTGKILLYVELGKERTRLVVPSRVQYFPFMAN